MDRKPEIVDERPRKRPKVQQSLTNMFSRKGPKFVEVVGVQLLCPYCHRKFRAPQGLVAHKHMHERAGHVIRKRRKVEYRAPSAKPFLIKAALDKRGEPVSNECASASPERKIQPKVENPVVMPALVDPVKRQLMTRRFSVAEKLRIIKKAKELNNISATCRWVQTEFHRSTFDRRSLKAMLEREDIYLKASGTKKIRKTVRDKTGMFPLMERELAK